VIGACTAYFLARRGIDVLIVERTEVAAAASGKAGGLLALDRWPAASAEDGGLSDLVASRGMPPLGGRGRRSRMSHCGQKVGEHSERIVARDPPAKGRYGRGPQAGSQESTDSKTPALRATATPCRSKLDARRSDLSASISCRR
jgi:glycine/D-amino acid oxidase-like deaminating enzyme